MVRWLECQNCGYEWGYTGDSDYYATCPRCGYKVNIEKREVENHSKTGGGT